MSSFVWPTPALNPGSTDPDELEANVRRLMASHAAIQSRGFDTDRLRRDLHRQIDALLDRHALATSTFDDLDAPLP